MNEPDSDSEQQPPTEEQEMMVERATESLYEAQEDVKDAQSDLREANVLTSQEEYQYDSVEEQLLELIGSVEESRGE